MTRHILIALGLSAALATAAFVRPPRATPAFSPAVTAAPSSAACLSCHPERRSRFAAPKSRDHANHHRGHQSHAHSAGSTRSRLRKHVELVDVNRADAAALARVPGITPDLARRIVAYRALVGPFATLDDLSDLDGLSEGRLISLGRYLVVP